VTPHSWRYSENTRFGYVPIPVPWFSWPWQLVQTINLLTHSMEQSPSWEVSRFAASQEIPRILWNPKLHNCITGAHHCPCPEPDQSSPCLHPISWRSILMLSPHLRLGLPSDIFLPGFPHQNHVYTSPLPHTCYMSLPISFISTWSPEQYRVRSTDH